MAAIADEESSSHDIAVTSNKGVHQDEVLGAVSPTLLPDDHDDSSKEQMVPVSEDSEAETEILSQTPQKKAALRDEPSLHAQDDTKPIPRSPQTGPHDLVNSNSSPSRASRKRKLLDEDIEQTQDRSSDHEQKSKDRNSSSKKARVGSNGNDNSSEDEPLSSEEESEDMARSESTRTRQRRRNHKSNNTTNTSYEPIQLATTKREKHHFTNLELDGNSARSSTLSPFTHPHSPPARSGHHRRASSFQTSSAVLTSTDRETRLRKRHEGSQDIQSPELPPPAPAGLHKTTSHIGSRRTQDGRTALARAADREDFDKVKELLLKWPKEIDIPDNGGNTPLQMAACNGAVEILRILIEAGAEVNTTNSLGESPLKDAKDNEHEEVIVLLQAAGAVAREGSKAQAALPKERLLYYQDLGTKPRFIKFAEAGDYEGVDICLNIRQKPDNDVMVAAARGGSAQCLELLVAEGGVADPDPEDVKFNTPMLAVLSRRPPESLNLDALKSLLNMNCDPFRTNENEETYRQIVMNRKAHGWEQAISTLDEYSKTLKQESSRDPSSDEQSGAEGDSKEVSVRPRRRRLISGEERQQEKREERRRYLETLPVGLRYAMEIGSDMPRCRLNSKEKRHERSVQDWRPIRVAHLSEIDKDVAPDAPNASELYIISFQAAIILGHDRLDRLFDQVDTRYATVQHRRRWIDGAGFREYICRAHNYTRLHPVKVAPLLNENNVFFEKDVDDNIIYHWYMVDDVEIPKFLRLSDNQIFWIKLDDFIRQTAPEITPHVKGELMRANFDVQLDYDRRPLNTLRKLEWQDGQIM